MRSAVLKTVLLLGLATCGSTAFAQERPYFVTYDQYLEEKKSLEIAIAKTSGIAKHDEPGYHAPWLEVEYGVAGWWTSEVYIEGVTVHDAGGGFTGWRWKADGALFWKISTGNSRSGMRAFSFLPAAQRWQLVLFLRTLGK